MKISQLLIERRYTSACHQTGRMLVLAAVMGVSAVAAVSQSPPVPSGELVLEHIDSVVAGIEDYTVDLDANVDLERLQVPPMHVTMYFKRPDKIHFASEGFALLPREGLALNTRQLRTRYAIAGVKRESLDSASVLVLALKPKTERSKLHDLSLYVDPEHWTVARFVSLLADSRLMTADFTYKQIQGHWLPSTLLVGFRSGPPDTSETDLFGQGTPTRRPINPRNGTITIRYSNYRINTGLRDELFERPSVKSGKE